LAKKSTAGKVMHLALCRPDTQQAGSSSEQQHTGQPGAAGQDLCRQCAD